jgi:hypothetical protein
MLIVTGGYRNLEREEFRELKSTQNLISDKKKSKGFR